jgi:Asp-tRNA(Asn)/Glu-tRNA(Gln) amidotransferase C subunit
MMYAIESGAKEVVELLAARSKATLSGRVKFRRDDKDVSLPVAEFAKHCAEQADRRYKDAPAYPDIGPTAYNDEYYFAIRGGDTVPVAQLEEEHREYREQLKAFANTANQVSRFLQAAVAPKATTAGLGM